MDISALCITNNKAACDVLCKIKRDTPEWYQINWDDVSDNPAMYRMITKHPDRVYVDIACSNPSPKVIQWLWRALEHDGGMMHDLDWVDLYMNPAAHEMVGHYMSIPHNWSFFEQLGLRSTDKELQEYQAENFKRPSVGMLPYPPRHQSHARREFELAKRGYPSDDEPMDEDPTEPIEEFALVQDAF